MLVAEGHRNQIDTKDQAGGPSFLRFSPDMGDLAPLTPGPCGRWERAVLGQIEENSHVGSLATDNKRRQPPSPLLRRVPLSRRFTYRYLLALMIFGVIAILWDRRQFGIAAASH